MVALPHLVTLTTIWRFILIFIAFKSWRININSLVASELLLVPLQCEFYALEGLAQLLKTVEAVKSNLNPNLELEGIVLTMYDSRNRLSEDVINDARKHMGNKVFNTIIPRNDRLSEAPSHGLPAILYDRKCMGSEAYIELAKEFINRIPSMIMKEKSKSWILND